MLKFERLGHDATVSIRLKERTSFFDRALFQALTWSLVIHLVLFGTFRIRMNDFRESSTQMAPIAVAIDFEPAALASIVDVEAVDTASLFTTQLGDDAYKKYVLARMPAAHEGASNNCELLAVHFTPKIYPMQLKTSRELKQLTLLEDGSKLFKDKGPHDDLGRYMLSSNHFPIEYKVIIDGTTGKIAQAERMFELLDKELQLCADKIIKEIRFMPFSQKTLKGSITLSFCCGGTEVKSVMHD